VSEFLMNLRPWHWLILAVALAAAETFVPGAVAIWFGASAAVIGLILFVIPVPWEWQWVGFSMLGLMALIAFRTYRRNHPDVSEQPNLNHRGQQYVGSELVLIEPIEQGAGRVKLGDGIWKVSGPELPAGARVRVTGANGTILIVVPA
jgi:membrane protein implicated in regulation of membrane protease activity